MDALFCVGFHRWKRSFIRAYLADVGRVKFVRGPVGARLRGFDRNSRLLTWGMRDEPGLLARAERWGIPTWRMEDGFLRSVGLGSDFTLPASLVLDTRGIYFDPNCPSDLEHILEHEVFSPETLQRAARIRARIVATAMSKYNFAVDPGREALHRPEHAGPVILVPGQVEGDASIRFGAVDIRSNLQLLQTVRSENPQAFIIYKPHPDVLAAHRESDPEELSGSRRVADAVITDRSISECLDVADEVHTMTSLVGFEGLLRGKRVAAYGRPFYSGWGLTQDRHCVDRRTRALTLDMLVAGTLLRYPRYLDQRTWQLTDAETVLDQLEEQRTLAAQGRAPQRRTRRWRKLMWTLRGGL